MSFGLQRARSALLALLWVVALSPLPVGAALRGPLVVSVSVSGNSHVPTDQILGVVKTKAGQPFDPRTVQDDLRNIFDLGCFADQVPPLIRQRPGGVSVTYRVIENPVLTSIAFSGNKHVPADTLLALMDTAVGQVLNTNTFHQDVLKINSYYDKIGYGGQVPTHVPDLSLDAKSGVLTLKIQEGLIVRNVIIAGDSALAPATILPALAVKAGQPFSEELRDKDVDTIKKLYEQHDLSLGNFEAGIVPSSVDLKAGTADVQYTIDAARIGAIQITGNTRTKDQVIRRELRMHPGDLIRQDALRRDYERLNNLGFFDKVDLNIKPGPDPKKPSLVTLDWNVKEERTGTASIGAGYSGGPTGEGLTGTLSFSENDINGTGNNAVISFQKGARVTNEQVSFRIPYLGNTPRSQKYSLAVSVFNNNDDYNYPIYSVPGGPTSQTPGAGATPAPIPVTIVPVNPTNPQTISGVYADYRSLARGISTTVGRRFSDYVTGTAGINWQTVASSASVPAGYVFSGTGAGTFLGGGSGSTNVFGLGSTTSGGQALGVTASSIAPVDSSRPYALHSVTLGVATDTRDDVFNPRRGMSVALTDELSTKALASDFNFTIPILDAAKFFPAPHNSTLGFHFKAGGTTGAIPPNRLFTLSQTELRAYKDVFYGTQLVLFQAEWRVPVTQDRKFAIAAFYDQGGTRIVGANPVFDISGNIVSNPAAWIYRSDVGIGVRFDLPQLGLHTIRLDYAIGQGSKGIAFGIGQSF